MLYTSRPGRDVILDMKTGDVNGDGIQDIVYLTGDKASDAYITNLKLVIQDGRTNFRTVVPLYLGYNSGFDPWLFLGDFTNNRVDDIFINLPVGGSGALTYYYLYSFLRNQVRALYTPEQFIIQNKELDFEVIYRNYYKVDITSKKLNQTFTLDVSNRRDTYAGVVYNRNGTLIKPTKGFILEPPHLYPIKLNGNEAFRLMALQDIAGLSHADRLGYLQSFWTFYTPKSIWVLNPRQASVVI